MSDMVTVEIGGTKYSVTKALAEKIEAERKAVKEREEDTSRKLEDLEAQVEAIAKRQTPEQQQTPNTKKGLDYNDLAKKFWENPEQAFRELHETTKQEIREEYNEEEAKKAEADESKRLLNEFYKDFYEKNEHLKGEEDLVEAILNNNFNRWRKLSREKLMEELEKNVTGVILRHSKQDKEDKDDKDEKGGQPFLVEGESMIKPTDGAENRGKGEGGEEGKKPRTTKEILAARKAARRQAQGKTS